LCRAFIRIMESLDLVTANIQTGLSAVSTDALRYVGIALIGERKPIGKAVANLGLLR
jgi:hypothetical protein